MPLIKSKILSILLILLTILISNILIISEISMNDKYSRTITMVIIIFNCLSMFVNILINLYINIFIFKFMTSNKFCEKVELFNFVNLLILFNCIFIFILKYFKLGNYYCLILFNPFTLLVYLLMYCYFSKYKSYNKKSLLIYIYPLYILINFFILLLNPINKFLLIKLIINNLVVMVNIAIQVCLYSYGFNRKVENQKKMNSVEISSGAIYILQIITIIMG